LTLLSHSNRHHYAILIGPTVSHASRWTQNARRNRFPYCYVVGPAAPAVPASVGRRIFKQFGGAACTVDRRLNAILYRVSDQAWMCGKMAPPSHGRRFTDWVRSGPEVVDRTRKLARALFKNTRTPMTFRSGGQRTAGAAAGRRTPGRRRAPEKVGRTDFSARSWASVCKQRKIRYLAVDNYCNCRCRKRRVDRRR
jgi:hypothetical protein